MKKEIWKDIPNYGGIYQASTYGRIRTCKGKTTYSKYHGVRHWKQRIIKPKGQTYATGYRVSLWKDGKCKDFLVARLVATTFLGESDLTVNHIDGNRFNNNIENLEWVSLADNIRKGFETGLYKAQMKILVYEKKTGKTNTFRSLAQASRHYGKNDGFFSNCINKGKLENEELSWTLI